MKDFYVLYNELIEITKELEPYYTIDKIKSFGVYVLAKDENVCNVFDIYPNGITYYEKHDIPQEAMPIINKIQDKLKEIENLTEKQ